MAPWERLGISEEEWRICQLSAAEASIARGANVTPYEVALEYILAREADGLAPTRRSPADTPAARTS